MPPKNVNSASPLPWEVEEDLTATIRHINNSISLLVDISKQYTSSPNDIGSLIGEMNAYTSLLTEMHRNIQDSSLEFPEAEIPGFIIQALEESVNLDIPSYNVSRDLMLQLEQFEAKVSTFHRYGQLLQSHVNNNKRSN